MSDKSIPDAPFDFGHLAALDIKGTDTKKYRIHQIEGAPTLIVSPATDANKPFTNALLRAMQKTRGSKQITASRMDESRDEDRVLYSKHIVKGWTGLKDRTGRDVPFTEAHCLQFLIKMPNWLFDELRAHCSEPANFVETDAAGTAGN